MFKGKGVSLIIPIYNVETYIEECLESVLASIANRSDVQVILVDDGAKDKSGLIAKEYAAKYSCISYFYKKNGGLSDARNFGLKYVEFDYVAFLDSDDTINRNFFPEIFKALKENPDMIIFDWLDVEEGKVPKKVNGMDFLEVLWSVQPGTWNKVYKSSLFKDIQFPKGKIFEDVGTTYKLLYYINDYVYINQPLYNYRKNREGSILSTVSLSINDLYSVLEETYNFYVAKDALNGEHRTGLCYQYVKLLCWSNMYRQLQFYKYNFLGFYLKMNKTRRLIYKRFPEWKQNEYLKRNTQFFSSRLGTGYINRLDCIGKSLFSTLHTVIFLVTKNQKRVN